jgi:AraC-like DNA-binding protein
MLIEDPLANILQTVRLKSTIFCRSELTAPWGVQITPEYEAMFHLVSQGHCWLKIDEQPTPVSLSRGDFFVLLQGHKHTLSDASDSAIVELEEIPFIQPNHGYKVLRYGGGGSLTSIISGCFQFQGDFQNPLTTALPPFIYIKEASGWIVPWLETTLQFLANEASVSQPGGQTVMTRVADILLVQAVRSHMAELSDTQSGWLRALTDPDISSILSLMHQHPEKTWTVEALAAQVSMSRSAFATRFRQLIGEPPLRYLTNWRLYRAAELLRCSNVGILTIAAQVGYDSEVAFSRAFKRWSGTAPGKYRRRFRCEE